MDAERYANVDWATAPLLDPANVGKFVWGVWNGNTKHAEPMPINKIGRTNIHVGRSNWSLRVHPDGTRAAGTVNNYGVSAMTNQWHQETEERQELKRRIRKLAESQMPDDLHILRAVADLLERVVYR